MALRVHFNILFHYMNTLSYFRTSIYKRIFEEVPVEENCSSPVLK